MTEMELKYGCNPNQKPSRIFMREGELPITVLNGKPGYINLLDAFNSWQLVRELKQATGLPASRLATSSVRIPVSPKCRKGPVAGTLLVSMEPTSGFEPLTYALRVRCSTS